MHHVYPDKGLILLLMGVAVQRYVDDTRTFAHSPTNAAFSLVERILEAASAHNLWMSPNRLPLNCDKTQSTCIGGHTQSPGTCQLRSNKCRH